VQRVVVEKCNPMRMRHLTCCGLQPTKSGERFDEKKLYGQKQNLFVYHTGERHILHEMKSKNNRQSISEKKSSTPYIFVEKSSFTVPSEEYGSSISFNPVEQIESYSKPGSREYHLEILRSTPI
jgi:hypothetical protein